MSGWDPEEFEAVFSCFWSSCKWLLLEAVRIRLSITMQLQYEPLWFTTAESADLKSEFHA